MKPQRHAILLLLGLVLTQPLVACAGPSKAQASQEDQTSLEPAVVVINEVKLEHDGVHQLSGIAYLGHEDYLLVSDKGGHVWTASIQVNKENGKITAAEITENIKSDAGDNEDIAIDRRAGLFVVCDEATQGITAHTFGNGERVHSYRVPLALKAKRPNLGFESLAIAPGTGHTWVANEEAMPNDGGRATSERGTLVRLQRFDTWMYPTRQFFYTTDPHTGDQNLLKRAQTGVVGLVALDRHRLIVMERTLGGRVIPAFRIRLYIVHTNVPETKDGSPATLEKELIAQVGAGLANYEGITLGPKLANGDYAVLLVSDDGGGEGRNPQRLLSLRVPAELIEPAQTPALPTPGD